MQEQITFQLTEDFLKKGLFDASAIGQELNAQMKSIQELLVGYHFKSRGRVFKVGVDESSIEILRPLMVKVVAIYSIGQFNACADVDFAERATMELLVDLDPESGIGIITGEYIPERAPDEF